MTKERTLEDLEAEACARANLFNKNLCNKVEVASLSLKSKLPFKALVLREVLLHRFTDQSLSASSSVASKLAVSAATMTRGSMETFARLFELHEYLSDFFDNPDLDGLDDFLMVRIFGARNRKLHWPKAVNILTTVDKVKKIVPNFRSNYDRLSEIAHPNYSGGLGVFQRLDIENHIVHLGDEGRIEQNLKMVSLLLIGTQDGFEKTYNATKHLVEKLNNAFEDGSLQHT